MHEGGSLFPFVPLLANQETLLLSQRPLDKDSTMDMYNNGGPEVSIRSLKKDSMKFVLTNTDLR